VSLEVLCRGTYWPEMNLCISALVAPFDDKSQASAVQRKYRATLYKTFICLFLTLLVVFQERNEKNNEKKHAIKNGFFKIYSVVLFLCFSPRCLILSLILSAFFFFVIFITCHVFNVNLNSRYFILQSNLKFVTL
jgi:hypothetical protein